MIEQARSGGVRAAFGAMDLLCCRNSVVDSRRKVILFSAEALNEEHKAEEHYPARAPVS